MIYKKRKEKRRNNSKEQRESRKRRQGKAKEQAKISHTFGLTNSQPKESISLNTRTDGRDSKIDFNDENN